MKEENIERNVAISFVIAILLVVICGFTGLYNLIIRNDDEHDIKQCKLASIATTGSFVGVYVDGDCYLIIKGNPVEIGAYADSVLKKG